MRVTKYCNIPLKVVFDKIISFNKENRKIQIITLGKIKSKEVSKKIKNPQDYKNNNQSIKI